MIPKRFEYATLLVFMALLLLALYSQQLKALFAIRSFWLGLGLFVLFCSLVEILALRAGWWEFNSQKIVGLSVASIPIEEYALFVGFYALIVAHWERR